MPTKENHYTAGDASVWQEEGTDKFFLPKKQHDLKYFHVMQNFPTYSGYVWQGICLEFGDCDPGRVCNAQCGSI